VSTVGEVLIGIGFADPDTKKLDEAARKVKKKARETEDAYKKASKEVQKAQDAVADATDKAARESARAVLKSAKRQQRAAKETANEARESWRSQEQASKRAADKSKAAAARFEKNWKKPLRRLGIGFAAMGAAAAAGLGKLVLSTAEVADAAAKDAAKLGLTAEAVQELGHAAELTGADFTKIKTGLRAFSRGLGDAIVKGTGPAAEAFERLGISIEDPLVQSQDLDRLLPMIADQLKNVESPTARAGLAMKLFADSGAELMPLFDQGSEGLARMRQEARDLGLVMSNESAKTAEEFKDELTRVKGTLRGVGHSIAAELMPAMRDQLAGLKDWIANNQELIRQDIPNVIRGMVTVMSTLAQWVGKIVGLISDLQTRWDRFIDKISSEDEGILRAAGVSEETIRAVQKRTTERGGVKTYSQIAEEEAQARFEKRIEGEFVGPAWTPDASGALKRRRKAFQESQALTPGGGGKGGTAEQRDAAERLAEARILVAAPGGIAESLQALATARGASSLATEKAIETAAKVLAEGSSEKVARKAAVDQLAKQVGFKVEFTKPETDPLLLSLLGPQAGASTVTDPLLAAALGPSEVSATPVTDVGATLAGILGDSNAPAVPMQAITKGHEPQVLLSTINNTYEIQITNEIDGAREPQTVAGEIESRFRALFRDEVQSLSKMSKVVFAR